mgnify:CR=1 FL=1|jgi:hypothetical protein
MADNPFVDPQFTQTAPTVDAARVFGRQLQEYEQGTHRPDPSMLNGSVKDFFGETFVVGDHILVMEVFDLADVLHRVPFNMRSEEKLWKHMKFLEMFGNTPRFKVLVDPK